MKKYLEEKREKIDKLKEHESNKFNGAILCKPEELEGDVVGDINVYYELDNAKHIAKFPVYTENYESNFPICRQCPKLFNIEDIPSDKIEISIENMKKSIDASAFIKHIIASWNLYDIPENIKERVISIIYQCNITKNDIKVPLDKLFKVLENDIKCGKDDTYLISIVKLACK